MGSPPGGPDRRALGDRLCLGVAGEHVTQQAIAQSLATLRERGLVEKQADPSDGRKSLVTATAAGRKLRASLTA